MSYDYQYDNYGIHGFMGDLVMEFELQDEDNKEVLILCHHFSNSFSLCICQIRTIKKFHLSVVLITYNVLILCHHFSDSFSLCICQIRTTKKFYWSVVLITYNFFEGQENIFYLLKNCFLVPQKTLYLGEYYNLQIKSSVVLVWQMQRLFISHPQ